MTKLGGLHLFAVGDWIDVDDGLVGVVVFNACRSEWSDEFPEADWPKSEYDGIMMRAGGALVFHPTTHFIGGRGRIRQCAEPT